MSFNDLIKLPSLREKLKSGGYQSLDELRETGILELTKELQLSTEEVEYVIKICGREPSVQKRTLAEIIATEQDNSISTSSNNFDKLLGHGIPPFKITELCGEPGSGKTQLCMQLAVNVQLDKKRGGVAGECLYIDTEGSFQASRFINIARRHVDYSIETLLKGIHVFRILDHAELIAVIRQLPEIMQQYPKIKLVIIDSIAYHFRLNVLDARARTAILNYIARMLVEMAKVFTLSVVVTNHVSPEAQNGPLTPSLGQDWGYWCTNRLFLFRRRHYRFGFLYKAVENENSRPVQFLIKDDGISDPQEDELEVVKKESEEEAELNEQMDSAWEDLKHAKVKQEEEDREFDELWNGDDNDEELISQAVEVLNSATQKNKSDNYNDDKVTIKDGSLVSDQGFAPSSQMIAEGVASLFDESAGSPLSELSTDQSSANDSNNKRKTPVEKVDQDNKRLKRSSSEASLQSPDNVDTAHQKEEAKTRATIASNNNSNLKNDTKNYWDSDLEEELDMDFLANIESYL